MQDKTELDIDISIGSSVLSFAQCIVELVGNSLNAHAAAIAIRIHTEKREIHIIDNGIGIPKEKLDHIIKSKAKVISTQMHELSRLHNTLTNIHQLSDTLTIASRYRDSTKTFMKMFKIGYAPNFVQIEQRPSHGTTISIYGFHEILSNKKWDISTICFLIATIAIEKLEVSFSIRDENCKKVVLRIARPHNPIEVLRTLFGKNLPLNHIWLIQCNAEYNMRYHGYIGLSDKNTMQWIFLNHKLIYCPFILKLIEIGFKRKLHLLNNKKFNRQDLYNKNMFILIFFTFSRKTYTFFTENEKRYVMFYDVPKILNNIKNSAFKCFTEQIANCTVTPDSCKMQLVKEIHLKSERNNKAITYYAEKEKNILNNFQCQTKNMSMECSKVYEKNVADKAYNNVDEMQKNFIDSANDSIRFNKRCNYYNNSDFVEIFSPLSVWSNWTYTNKEERNSSKNINSTFSKNNMHSQELFECAKQFNFLPRKLYNLLRHRVKLTNMQCLNSPNNTVLFKENWQYKQISVHPCKQKQKLCEFRLSRTSLKYIKIVNQVNNEFIAAWIIYKKMKILLMMDQHAVHERIRYENLLLRYKVQNEDELLSFNLRNPIAIKLPREECNLLLHNKMLLKKYGINLGSLKENTLLIRTIPECLITNNDYCNTEKILPKICGLLNDILKKRNTTNHANMLPLTIHNAIASEACHGAVKFGDKLTLEQCVHLVKLLNNTKFPNRCAHGRPTIVPVMELSELERRNPKKCENS